MTQCTAALEQVAAAQARTEMMSKSVADGLVRAPFDGVVSEKMVVARRVGRARQAAVHARRRRPAEDRALGPEIAVAAIKKGQRVELIAVAHPEQDVSARRSRGSAPRSAGRASLIVEATLDKGTEPRARACSPRRTSRSARRTRVVVPADAVVQRGKSGTRSSIKNGERRGAHRSARPAPGAGPGLDPPGRRQGRQGRRQGHRPDRRRREGRWSNAMQWLANICVRRPIFAIVLIARARRRRPRSATSASASTSSPRSTSRSSRSSRRTPARRRARSRPTSPRRSRRRSTPSAASTR